MNVKLNPKNRIRKKYIFQCSITLSIHFYQPGRYLEENCTGQPQQSQSEKIVLIYNGC